MGGGGQPGGSVRQPSRRAVEKCHSGNKWDSPKFVHTAGLAGPNRYPPWFCSVLHPATGRKDFSVWKLNGNPGQRRLTARPRSLNHQPDSSVRTAVHWLNSDFTLCPCYRAETLHFIALVPKQSLGGTECGALPPSMSSQSKWEESRRVGSSRELVNRKK